METFLRQLLAYLKISERRIEIYIQLFFSRAGLSETRDEDIGRQYGIERPTVTNVYARINQKLNGLAKKLRIFTPTSRLKGLDILLLYWDGQKLSLPQKTNQKMVRQSPVPLHSLDLFGVGWVVEALVILGITAVVLALFYWRAVMDKGSRKQWLASYFGLSRVLSMKAFSSRLVDSAAWTMMFIGTGISMAGALFNLPMDYRIFSNGQLLTFGIAIFLSSIFVIENPQRQYRQAKSAAFWLTILLSLLTLFVNPQQYHFGILGHLLSIWIGAFIPPIMATQWVNFIRKRISASPQDSLTTRQFEPGQSRRGNITDLYTYLIHHLRVLMNEGGELQLFTDQAKKVVRLYGLGVNETVKVLGDNFKNLKGGIWIQTRPVTSLMRTLNFHEAMLKAARKLELNELIVIFGFRETKHLIAMVLSASQGSFDARGLEDGEIMWGQLYQNGLLRLFGIVDQNDMPLAENLTETAAFRFQEIPHEQALGIAQLIENEQKILEITYKAGELHRKAELLRDHPPSSPTALKRLQKSVKNLIRTLDGELPRADRLMSPRAYEALFDKVSMSMTIAQKVLDLSHRLDETPILDDVARLFARKHKTYNDMTNAEVLESLTDREIDLWARIKEKGIRNFIPDNEEEFRALEHFDRIGLEKRMETISLDELLAEKTKRQKNVTVIKTGNDSSSQGTLGAYAAVESFSVLIDLLWQALRTRNNIKARKIKRHLNRDRDVRLWMLAALSSGSNGTPVSREEWGKSKTIRGRLKMADQYIESIPKRDGRFSDASFGDFQDVSIVASELINDVYLHAGAGALIVRKVFDGDRRGIEIVAIDCGPGMSAETIEKSQNLLDDLLVETHRGLYIIRSLVNEFHIESVVGEGTKITALKWFSPDDSKAAVGSHALGAYVMIDPIALMGILGMVAGAARINQRGSISINRILDKLQLVGEASFVLCLEKHPLTSLRGIIYSI